MLLGKGDQILILYGKLLQSLMRRVFEIWSASIHIEIRSKFCIKMLYSVVFHSMWNLDVKLAKLIVKKNALLISIQTFKCFSCS
ncbi:hypothetical protein RIF29_28216 [Crotalaria pallida]|uniref:Uncharacterized protein n=1 Tax=Crotalaria pallida TaxID=3830 RepID=A0AAN9I157_CROPI